MWLVIRCIVARSAWLAVVTAFAGDLPEPISFLKAALQTEQDAPSLHKVEVQQEEGFQVKIESYIKRAPDGFLFKREEQTILNNKGSSLVKEIKNVDIQNREGVWHISKQAAILKEFEGKDFKAALEVDPNDGKPPIDSRNQYKIVEVTYGDRPCFAIHMTLDDRLYERRAEDRQRIMDAFYLRNSKSMDVLCRHFAPKGNKMKDFAPPLAAKDLVPCRYEYVIDRDTRIIWSIKTYSKGGDLIHGSDYSEVERGLPLADDLFTLPKGVKRYTAATLADFIKLKSNQ